MQRRLVGNRVGEYELLRLIGRGGMGEVYEGIQRLIGKRVAVKVLLPHLSKQREPLARFLAEARAVNAIRHRGIIDIFGFGTMEDGSSYCVMELLEGRSFEEVIREGAPLPTNEVLRWSVQVLEALDAAHLAGVIHRDLKPSNVMLLDGQGTRQGEVKLLDFGIAKLDATPGQLTPQTHASIAVGTPQYMSPEQAKGEPVGASTDLYAYGCMMFEMLTGKLPFDAKNPVDILYARVERAAPLLRTVKSDAPKEMEALLEWMLQTDPLERPQTAAELLEHVTALRERFPARDDAPGGKLKLSGGSVPPGAALPTFETMRDGVLRPGEFDVNATKEAPTNPTPILPTPISGPIRLPMHTVSVPPPADAKVDLESTDPYPQSQPEPKVDYDATETHQRPPAKVDPDATETHERPPVMRAFADVTDLHRRADGSPLESGPTAAALSPEPATAVTAPEAKSSKTFVAVMVALLLLALSAVGAFALLLNR